MIASPIFWWRPSGGVSALLLAPAARLLALHTVRRMSRPARARVGAPVICVGNLTVGGAGKTPTVIALAEAARAMGRTPGFLTRGYGGTTSGPLLVEPGRHGAEMVGDEALLLAAEAPTVVAVDRPDGARLLLRTGVDLILMDDGFQNPSLHKDVSILVVDAATGLGNGYCVPAGPMRAPLMPQVLLSSAIVVMGEGEAADGVVRAAARAGRPTHRARIVPRRVPFWQGRPLLAYAGIGRPEKFFATLSQMHAVVKLARPFPDHHVYSEAEAEALLARADEDGLKLVTTGKDKARLTGRGGALQRLDEASEALPVMVSFEHPDAPAGLIGEAIRRAARRTA